jgi:hypothetical protein
MNMAAGESGTPPISLFHRSAAAAGASLVSAIVVNPLDVVKVRSNPCLSISYHSLAPIQNILRLPTF